ncbi:hypothetical protein FRB90_006859 [Tulasnella sp. 427]|nr:hypothetical protein FRB90_006859 [Tulasnella sp. 427]
MSLPKAAPQIRTERGSETPTKQSLTDKARVYEPVQGQLEDTEYSSVSDAGDDTPRAETSLSQRQLVAKAFASDNVIEEFSKEKEILTARESASKMEKQPLPGWGSWTGTGIAGKRSVKVPPSTSYSGKSATRRDTGKAHVMVSEKRDLKASKYQIKDIPFPYTSRAQYERSLEVPLGTEWNTRLGHQKAVLPRVSAKMGVAIEPLEIL